jgi:hypothetical protein
MTLLAYSAQLLASAGSLLMLPMDNQVDAKLSCHSAPSTVSTPIPSAVASVQSISPPSINQPTSSPVISIMVNHDPMTCCDNDNCDMPSCHASYAIPSHFVISTFPFGHHPVFFSPMISLPSFVVSQYRPPILG